MIKAQLSYTKEMFRELRKNEEGASHILEIAASLAIVGTILSLVFTDITTKITTKITAVITQAIGSF